MELNDLKHSMQAEQQKFEEAQQELEIEKAEVNPPTY